MPGKVVVEKESLIPMIGLWILGGTLIYVFSPGWDFMLGGLVISWALCLVSANLIKDPKVRHVTYLSTAVVFNLFFGMVALSAIRSLFI